MMDFSRVILIYISSACIVITRVTVCVEAACVTTEFYLSNERTKQNVTRENIPCQRWDQLPSLTADISFGNESFTEAGNECRATDDTTYWCFAIPEKNNIECFEDTSQTYMGKTSMTRSDHLCQTWSENTPNSHNFGDSNFPDGSIADAHNYCRDPDNLGIPWCFTTTDRIRWEDCNILKCKPLQEKVERTDCGITFCAPVPSGCPRGWRRSADGRICYSVGGSRATWIEAVGICESLGAKLLEIDDYNEYFFLLNVIIKEEKDTFWTGLNDINAEGIFTWYSSGEIATYTDWHPNEPDNFFDMEDCVSMFLSKEGFKWRDDNCERSYNYICEIEANEEEIMETTIATKKEPSNKAISATKEVQIEFTTLSDSTSGCERCGIPFAVATVMMTLTQWHIY